MSKNSDYLIRVNKILKEIDFEKLDGSCNGSDKSYAKEILRKLHDELMTVYGTDYLDWRSGDFVDIPAVIKGRNSGHVSLGLVTVDLESSGEHYGTYIFSRKGVIDHGDDAITEAAQNFLNTLYIPYDYWYTPYIEHDHHVDYENIPDDVREIMSDYIENLRQSDEETETAVETQADEQGVKQ